MAKEIGSHILEFQIGESLEVLRALGNDARIEIVKILAAGDKNINEIAQAMSMSQPTVTRHIQQLEQAGIVASRYMPGVQGMQKRCSLRCSRLIFDIEAGQPEEGRVDEISMPIGLYTLVNPSGTCGLASRTKFIGFLDKPQSFFDPERATAEILWMAAGFVEYTFPNDLPSSMDVERLELIMEVCSEAPDYNPDYPSDLTLWINGVEVGTYTSPGDFGGKRGLLTPDWWVEHMTQFGLLKIWSVDRDGSSVDGNRISNISLSRLMIEPQQPITIRLGVKPEAEHQGGFNLFGRGFGNYPQDLVLRLHYVRKRSNDPRTDSLSAGSSERS